MQENEDLHTIQANKSQRLLLSQLFFMINFFQLNAINKHIK